jgi:formylglycine-generating enzyme required for sulfatase activity
VEGILDELKDYRAWVDPLLRQALAKPPESREHLHASLALLPGDPGQAAYLYGRLLQALPGEVPVISKALGGDEGLRQRLWGEVGDEHAAADARLRAACALAGYPPAEGDGEHWQAAASFVAGRLLAAVQEDPASYAAWLNLLRPVRDRLAGPLGESFRNRGRPEDARTAASLLADYLGNQPAALAKLLLDADARQFAVLYPRLQEQGERGLPVLTGEIDKKPLLVKDKITFETTGKIVGEDAKVKPSQGAAMPAKWFPVRLQAGKRYCMTMDSKDLDSFLVLQDKTGKELDYDDDSGGNLNAMLIYGPARDDTYTVFAASFKGTGSFHLRIVEVFGDGDKEELAKRQANAAVALLRMKQPAKVWPLLKHSPDPRVRSYLIHRLAPLGADAGTIRKRLDEELDMTIRRALLLSLGAFGEQELPTEVRRRLVPKLQGLYRREADPGLHAAVEWLLRQWQGEPWLKQVNEAWAKNEKERGRRIEAIRQLVKKEKEKTPPQWYVTSQGQTMVVIPGPVEFLMGSPPTEEGRDVGETQHRRRIRRTYALATKPVTVVEFRQFVKESKLEAWFEGGGQAAPMMKQYSPEKDCPMILVDWYRAAAYCNWLSKVEGIPKAEWCYQTDVRGNVTGLKAGYLRLAGYRLPSEAEWEFACRAGAVTSRYYGETEELLPWYGWYSKNSGERSRPVGRKKPNDLGLFDMHGNVFTWCQESFKGASPASVDGEAIADEEDQLQIIYSSGRMLRGGSFSNHVVTLRSANRYWDMPANRNYHAGIRPARTFR